MRPYNSPTSIKLQNASYATQYCPTPPLPPSITDRPWWERLRDRQGNSKSQSGADPKSTQSSMQNPTLKSPASQETYLRKTGPQTVADVQTNKTTFMGVYVNPGCPPELPAEYRFSHRVVQKRSGEWCFLPLIYDTVPESWCWTQEDRAFDAANQAQPVEKTRRERTDLQDTIFSDKPQPYPVEEAQETTESPKTRFSDHKPALRSAEVITESPKTRFSDHPITGSPDHPIPNDPPISSDERTAAEVMNNIEAEITKYLICSPHQRTVLALWILHTYCPIASATTPYLNIYSPVEQSGKSTCLGFLRAYSAQPWFASGVPASTLTRKIIADRPTVLLDNWHTTFRGSDKHHVTGFLLNSCEHFQFFSLFERGSVREAQVYCPKAFAGMTSLPPTLAQRSIPIVLQRRLPHQEVDPVFTLLYPEATAGFRTWAQQWAKDHLAEIDDNTMKPSHRKSLSALSPHQQSGCQTLLGIAETLGGEWLEKARTALLEIFREEQAREASATQLLSDVYDAFASRNHAERIFTNELLDYLHSLDHRQWHEWNKGQPMTAHTLSGMLRKHFNIYSRSQRRDKQKRRGYQQSDFTDAWQRYLPAQNDTESTHEDTPDCQGPVPCGIGFRSPDVPITRSPDLSKSPDDTVHGPSLSQTAFHPGKTGLVSMSQFKASWKKSSLILKRIAGKVVGVFVATCT